MSERQIINIATLHDGLNMKDDPNTPNLPEGATEVCIGVDLTVSGVVRTAKGYTSHDLGTDIPSGVDIAWAQIVWMNNARYVLCTSIDNLFYVNGTEVTAASVPSGRFKAIAIGSNIYILCTSSAFRYDGTSIYRWGIQAPSTAPTITASDASDKIIEDFESLATWIANASNCTVSAEATIVKEGSQSMKMAIASETIASSYITWSTVKDFNEFDDASESFVGDTIRLWVYVADLSKIESIKLSFDTATGSFISNVFSFTTMFQRVVTETTQITETTKGVSEEVVPYLTPLQYQPEHRLGGEGNIEHNTIAIQMHEEQYQMSQRQLAGRLSDFADKPGVYTFAELLYGDHGFAAPEGTVPTTTKDVTMVKTVTPVKQIDFQSGAWCSLDIPKRSFAEIGSPDWTTVKGVKITVGALEAVNLYFDELSIVGGGKLTGEYYFMYGWARTDGNNNIIHYSGPARDADGELNIQGPIIFDRQKIEWGTRTPSSDPQVDCCVIYISGGTLPGWYVGHVIYDNGTDSDSYGITEDDIIKPMVSLRNEPAPGGNDMLWWLNRIWIAGPESNRSGIRCSAISSDGDIMIEAFPARNTVIVGEGGKELLSINELNNQIVALGGGGELSLTLADPGELSSVSASRPSTKEVVGRDGYLIIDDNIVYPAVDSFIQSNGMTAKAVLPEMSSIIPLSSMTNARGVYRSFDGFFYFNMPVWGDVVAQLDFFSGKPRIALRGQYKVDCFLYEEEKTYAVINGTVYLFDSGYNANGEELWMQIRSKTFTLNKTVAWNHLSFQHNTGGNYFRVRVFIDGVDRGYKPFMSTTRTTEYFRFGPLSGNGLQVQFEGYYRSDDERTYGEIFLPVRVFLDA